MTGLHVNRVLRAAGATAIVGLGVCTSAFAQFLKTENFDDDPGWIGVNNTQFDELVDTDENGTPRNGHTNFGFSNTDNTGTAVLPPDFDGAGPFVPTASGPGEA